MRPMDLASLLLIAQLSSADLACMEELSLKAPPTLGYQLSLYRRCLGKLRAQQENKELLERRIQRMDQHFWRDKESTSRLRTSTERHLQRTIRVNQSRRASALDTRSERSKLLRSVRRDTRRAIRARERQRDASQETATE
jgi:hypothetical protein